MCHVLIGEQHQQDVGYCIQGFTYTKFSSFYLVKSQTLLVFHSVLLFTLVLPTLNSFFFSQNTHGAVMDTNHFPTCFAFSKENNINVREILNSQQIITFKPWIVPIFRMSNFSRINGSFYFIMKRISDTNISRENTDKNSKMTSKKASTSRNPMRASRCTINVAFFIRVRLDGVIEKFWKIYNFR